MANCSLKVSDHLLPVLSFILTCQKYFNFLTIITGNIYGIENNVKTR